MGNTETRKLVGAGEYSTVYRGCHDLTPVVVKTVNRTIPIEHFKAILAEVKAMAFVKDHANIVKFLGADVSAINTRKQAEV